MSNTTRELLAEGCTLAFAYRWSDGFRQVAYLKPCEAAEHATFLAENPRLARRCYVRDLRTGRFARL